MSYPSYISSSISKPDPFLNSGHWPHQVLKYAMFSCISEPFWVDHFIPKKFPCLLIPHPYLAASTHLSALANATSSGKPWLWFTPLLRVFVTPGLFPPKSPQSFSQYITIAPLLIYLSHLPLSISGIKLRHEMVESLTILTYKLGNIMWFYPTQGP